MDSLPPNDPNNNNNLGRGAAKEQPYDGRRRQRNGSNDNSNGAPMDMIGDMSDSPMVVVMFLVSLATYFLKERCVC